MADGEQDRPTGPLDSWNKSTGMYAFDTVPFNDAAEPCRHLEINCAACNEGFSLPFALTSEISAEFGREDPPYEDLAVHVLERALLWIDSRVFGRQGSAAHPCGRHFWGCKEAHKLHVPAAEAAATTA